LSRVSPARGEPGVDGRYVGLLLLGIVTVIAVIAVVAIELGIHAVQNRSH